MDHSEVGVPNLGHEATHLGLEKRDAPRWFAMAMIMMQCVGLAPGMGAEAEHTLEPNVLAALQDSTSHKLFSSSPLLLRFRSMSVNVRLTMTYPEYMLPRPRLLRNEM